VKPALAAVLVLSDRQRVASFDGVPLAPGHVKPELTGSDPHYFLTADGGLSMRVSRLILTLPTRERRPR
jgi:hypothetical protein